MKVGFIGLGMMGKGMAANLQKAGHQLVVHDLRRAAAEPYHRRTGLVWADSPKAVAEARSRSSFTSLPGPGRCRGRRARLRNGLIEGMKPDTAFFDMSDQLGLGRAQDQRPAFAEKNLYMLADSPVSGGPGGAASSKRWRSGSAATSSSSTVMPRCSAQWATRPDISARSAPARSPSSSTTAPAR